MEQKLVRVPFDLELAKKISNKECEGIIVTRDCRNARIVCFDRVGNNNIIALVKEEFKEMIIAYNDKGQTTDKYESSADLMLGIPEYMTFKDGDVIAFGSNEDSIAIGIFNRQTSEKSHECYVMRAVYGALVFDAKPLTYKNARFATEPEKQRLIDALRESKKPKAKEYLKRFFRIEDYPKLSNSSNIGKNYEFKPFDKVLVRQSSEDNWEAMLFSNYTDKRHKYRCCGMNYMHCIPYEGNEHLLGTKENWSNQ